MQRMELPHPHFYHRHPLGYEKNARDTFADGVQSKGTLGRYFVMEHVFKQ